MIKNVSPEPVSVAGEKCDVVLIGTPAMEKVTTPLKPPDDSSRMSNNVPLPRLTICALGVSGPFSSAKSPPVTSLAVTAVSSETAPHPTSPTSPIAITQRCTVRIPIPPPAFYLASHHVDAASDEKSMNETCLCAHRSPANAGVGSP